MVWFCRQKYSKSFKFFSLAPPALAITRVYIHDQECAQNMSRLCASFLCIFIPLRNFAQIFDSMTIVQKFIIFLGSHLYHTGYCILNTKTRHIHFPRSHLSHSVYCMYVSSAEIRQKHYKYFHVYGFDDKHIARSYCTHFCGVFEGGMLHNRDLTLTTFQICTLKSSSRLGTNKHSWDFLCNNSYSKPRLFLDKTVE